MKAVKARELLVRAKNRVGVLADLSSLIAGVSVNIRAISARGVSDEALFRLIVSDNAKIKGVLTQKGYAVSEEDAVVVTEWLGDAPTEALGKLVKHGGERDHQRGRGFKGRMFGEGPNGRLFEGRFEIRPYSPPADRDHADQTDDETAVAVGEAV